MKAKNYIVKSGNEWLDIVPIEPFIVEPIMEAASRALEKYLKDEGEKTFPILYEIYLPKDEPNKKKHYFCGSYFVLINIGQHSLAEDLRQHFKKVHKIDVSKTF